MIHSSSLVALPIAAAVLLVVRPSLAHDSYLDWHRPNWVVARFDEHETRGVDDAKVQISFRVNLFRGGPTSLQLGYTQRSLWNVGGESSPFTATDFNPELFLEFDLPSPWVPFARLGVEHESNGVDEELDSRTWERAFLSTRFAAGTRADRRFGELVNDGTGWGASLDVKAWLISTNEEEQPLFERYAGYWEAELDLTYHLGARRRGILRNLVRCGGIDVRLRGLPLEEGDRGFVEAGARVGLGRVLQAYVQYFRGYGELITFFDEDGWRDGTWWAGLRFGY